MFNCDAKTMRSASSMPHFGSCIAAFKVESWKDSKNINIFEMYLLKTSSRSVQVKSRGSYGCSWTGETRAGTCVEDRIGASRKGGGDHEDQDPGS